MFNYMMFLKFQAAFIFTRFYQIWMIPRDILLSYGSYGHGSSGADSPSAAPHSDHFWLESAPAVVQLPCGTMDWDYLSGFVLFCLLPDSTVAQPVGQVSSEVLQ